MYNRDFGGIKSEGQLYNFEQEYNASRRQEEPPSSESSASQNPCERDASPSRNGLFRNLQIDDLILIGIGILLLLDSEQNNDIFVLVLALLLIF